MVSTETNLPAEFDPKSGKNIVWSTGLGTQSHGSPIIAGGRVYIGTNNGQPRNPKHQGDRGVLMCFDEKSGSFLWQLVVPKRSEDPYLDWPETGLASEATVEGDRVYIVSNRGEVLCLDPRGLANGNDGEFKDEARHQTPATSSISPLIPTVATDADILWLFDMVSQAGIWTHDGAHSSILVHGDYLYLNTGTGVDNTHRKIRTPDAPSLIVLDKKTGRLVARDQERIAPNIFHATWSSPSVGTVNGRELIFFAGGNGIVYAFEPITRALAEGQIAALKKVWEFDPDPTAPKENVHRFTTNRREGPSNIYGMPVLFGNRLYITGGGDLWWGKNEAWLKCIDPTREGNVTKTAEFWTCPLERHTMSTPAIINDLVFVSDCAHNVHCVDRKTGHDLWTHQTKGEIWASPYIADGKVYIGTRHGDFYVFAADREKKLLNSTEFGAPISATTTAANGRLYISTMTDLFAIGFEIKQP
ncbi:MAG TPA: PQQ-binding-like beta-propeller repeat protein [Verrucomicrobiae bacterium]|nr:PQQ-binding-like beta-propeller repeat protein [Verrucomicrobiae bacterium]